MRILMRIFLGACPINDSDIHDYSSDMHVEAASLC